jgi:hypothetical protein
MKKIMQLSTMFLLIATIACSQKVINDANAEPRSFSGSFNEVHVSSAIDLILTKGDEAAVVVSASEDKYRDLIVTELRGNALYIYQKPGDKINWLFDNVNRKQKAYVSYITLNKIVASGASDVYVEGEIKSNDLNITVSGASDFKGKVNCTNLILKNSGASDVNITGTANNAELQCSGSSDVKAYDLITNTCTVKASGSSDVRITVNNSINAEASGSSDISYKGNPKNVQVQNRGSSDITHRKG